MNNIELITAIATAFFLSFFAGWVLRWVYGGLKRVNSTNMQEIDDLASRLQMAEEEVERITAEYEAQIAEQRKQIIQVQSELEAAMTGLGNARREIEMLRQE